MSSPRVEWTGWRADAPSLARGGTVFPLCPRPVGRGHPREKQATEVPSLGQDAGRTAAHSTGLDDVRQSQPHATQHPRVNLALRQAGRGGHGSKLLIPSAKGQLWGTWGSTEAKPAYEMPTPGPNWAGPEHSSTRDCEPPRPYSSWHGSREENGGEDRVEVWAGAVLLPRSLWRTCMAFVGPKQCPDLEGKWTRRRSDYGRSESGLCHGVLTLHPQRRGQ